MRTVRVGVDGMRQEMQKGIAEEPSSSKREEDFEEALVVGVCAVNRDEV